jgi:hypothetical protein
MEKSLLSLAVAASTAGLASLASAQMQINNEHTGEALVFPLYSTQGGNDTYIHIVNTTSQYKAVKVRMLEGEESLEALYFNLYLSPRDHFSFAITADGDGALLRTGDNSCTVPAITGDVPFSYLVSADESREQMGHIEVIEMGQIDPDSATAEDMEQVDGVPGDCAQLVTNWGDGGAWAGEAGAAGVGTTHFNASWNGGGLYGVATVINVPKGTAFGYDAVAIKELVAAGSAGSVLHYAPSKEGPDFGDAALGADNVSELFRVGSVRNDFVVDADINGLTDWVVTMPTKSQYSNGSTLDAPFSSDSCQEVSLTGYNREAGTQDAAILELCAGTNVIHFGSASATNTESNLVNAMSAVDGWSAGWAKLDLTADNERVLGDLGGLPVTGFAVVEYQNGALGNGTLANYQMAWEHKTSIASSSGTSSAD